MALIKCPECQKEISEKAKACPHCGFPITKKKVRVCKKALEYARMLEERESTFGNLSKVIRLYSTYSPQNIYVYEDTNTIFIANKQYSFCDILSCHTDTRKYVARTTQETKSDSDVPEQTTREKMYHYVFIGVNDIANPLITLQFGQNIVLANEVCALMNVIIRFNETKTL